MASWPMFSAGSKTSLLLAMETPTLSPNPRMSNNLHYFQAYIERSGVHSFDRPLSTFTLTSNHTEAMMILSMYNRIAGIPAAVPLDSMNTSIA